MKPILFPSIITAVMGFAGYSITQKDLDTGIFMLTDSSLELLGQSSVSWDEMSKGSADAAAAISAASIPTSAPSAPQEAPAANVAQEVAPAESEQEAIPQEFADLAKRRPVEYAAVVKAFRQANKDGRVVAMKDVVWRNYRVAS